MEAGVRDRDSSFDEATVPNIALKLRSEGADNRGDLHEWANRCLELKNRGESRSGHQSNRANESGMISEIDRPSWVRTLATAQCGNLDALPRRTH